MKLLSTLNDQELVQLFQKGYSKAFETLMQRHTHRIHIVILLTIKDKSLAEDLLQDVVIKMMQFIKEGRYNEDGKFLPWAVRIARNYCIDYIRVATRTPTIASLEFQDTIRVNLLFEESPESKLIKKQSNDFVRDLVNALPEDQRQVVMYRYYEDMSFKEIASLTNCSINTALGRMRYGLANLRKLIKIKPQYA